MLKIFETRKGRIFTIATAAALVVGLFAGYLVFNVGGTSNIKAAAPETSSESRFPAAIALNKTSLKLAVGQKTSLKAILTPYDADNTTVQWVSEDRSVADVDNGDVLALGAGITQLTATTLNGKQAVCTVSVSTDASSSQASSSSAESSQLSTASSASAPVVIAVTSVDFPNRAITLAIGATTQLKPKITPSSATVQTLKWDTSNSNVVTVDQSGNVTAVGDGTAYVHATNVDGQRDTCTIKVQSGSQAVASNNGSASNQTITTEPKLPPNTELYKTFGGTSVCYNPLYGSINMQVDITSARQNPQDMGKEINIKIYENGNLFKSGWEGIVCNEQTSFLTFCLDANMINGYYYVKAATYEVKCYAGSDATPFCDVTFSVDQNGYTK